MYFRRYPFALGSKLDQVGPVSTQSGTNSAASRLRSAWRKQRSFADDLPNRGWRKRELLIEASVAGLELNPISVSFFHHAPARRVLNKILEPRNAVTISVNHMLVPIDLKANPPAFL
jgi:hypothetical protein